MADLAGIFARVAVAVSGSTGGPYFASTLVRPGQAVYDDGGSIVSPGVPAEYPCMVQVDACPEAMRQAEGFTERDLRLLVLRGSIAGLPSRMTTDDSVAVLDGPNAGSYSVQSVGGDPYSIYYECRGRVA